MQTYCTLYPFGTREAMSLEPHQYRIEVRAGLLGRGRGGRGGWWEGGRQGGGEEAGKRGGGWR